MKRTLIILMLVIGFCGAQTAVTSLSLIKVNSLLEQSHAQSEQQQQQVINGQKELPAILTQIADTVANQDKAAIDAVAAQNGSQTEQVLAAIEAALRAKGQQVTCTQNALGIECHEKKTPKKGK